MSEKNDVDAAAVLLELRTIIGNLTQELAIERAINRTRNETKNES